jgi:hypothetical protein
MKTTEVSSSLRMIVPLQRVVVFGDRRLNVDDGCRGGIVTARHCSAV